MHIKWTSKEVYLVAMEAARYGILLEECNKKAGVELFLFK
jgi:hypothetical protein